MSDRLIPGFKVGNEQDLEAATGLTVVICEEGATPGVDIRGAAPGTRETDLMRPENLVDKVHAIVLAGGSAFGLAAADGAMRWLAEHDIGWPTAGGKVPIVASAILYDLGIGDSGRRPNADMAYRACENAGARVPALGSVGAGTGATVAKALGMERCLKGGLGFAEEKLASGLTVQALAAVNASGSIVDPNTAMIVAAPRGDSAGSFKDTIELLRTGEALEAQRLVAAGSNTTLGVVVTNAVLTKQEATRLAMMAQAGVARTTLPAHTMSDGDAVFVMAHGAKEVQPGELTSLGALAALAMERAIVAGVTQATALAGVPSASDWLA